MLREVAIFMYAVSLFIMMVGYHNIDIAYNLRTIERNFNVRLVDVSIGNILQTPDECYLSGLRAWMSAVFVQFISIALLILQKR